MEYLESNEAVPLSATENMLYHYLSFINIADFWARAEKIRNLNRIVKPLLVSNFIELLDDSIGLDTIKERSKRAGRQVVLFVDKEKQYG